MTVPVNDRRTGPTLGNGSQTSFPYDFKIYTVTDIQVWVRDTVTGAVTLKSFPAHYTLTGVGSDSGGDVVFVTAPTSTEEVLRLGAVPLDQPENLLVGDVFFEVSLQTAVDRLAMLLQQTNERLARALIAAKHQAPTGGYLELPLLTASDAGKILSVASHDPYSFAVTAPFAPGTLNVSPFITTLLDDASAAAAQVTLNAADLAAFNSHTTDLDAHSRLVMLSEPVNKVTLDGTTAAGSWNTVSIAADTSSNTARYAILYVRALVFRDTGTLAKTLKVQLRKKGTTPITPYEIDARIPVDSSDQVGKDAALLIVPVDSNEEFEWLIDKVGTTLDANDAFLIQLQGYWT